ncbi:hypothetical protein SAMN04487851_11481 [Prevotella sp. tc2-28]|uniref:hypothetical protein n=1 Tax=Prevotella sp. tc2-28 TaxID=1761888 RepID=UPI00089B8780|nr:hypothetical protein [Prevotella sp. tc2-28]SEA80169.1 hypothetical protein SAMN04487851_11481 [Prevotella sp. tc2-28]
MKKKINFNDASFKEVIGTSSYRGYVKTTANALSMVLGSPMSGDGDKTTYEWYKKYGSVVFTIYDYKEYAGITKNTEVEYHIGTKCPEDTGIIVGILAGLGFNAYIEK